MNRYIVLFVALIILQFSKLLSTPLVKTEEDIYVISDVNIVDVENATILPSRNIIIKNGVIADIHEQIKLKNIKTIDGKGQFVIPGLWDMHVHLQDLGDSSLQQFLYYGVTQVRDMGGDPELIKSYKSHVNSEKWKGPKIYSSLYMIGSPRFSDIMQKFLSKEEWQAEQNRRIIVSNAEEAKEAVSKIKEEGGDFVKLHWNHDDVTLEEIVRRAKDLDLDVVGHDPGHTMSLIDIANSGMKSYEHADGGFFYKLSQLTSEELKNTIETIKKTNLYISPTLVFWNSNSRLDKITDRAEAPDRLAVHPDGLTLDPKLRYFWKTLIATLPPKLLTWDLVGKDIDYLKTLYSSGVKILAATDTGLPGTYPGYSLIEELQTLNSKMGVTPAEALKIATLDAARFMGQEKSLGSIEKDKVANLVLLGSNPLESIGALYDVKSVVKEGRFLKRNDILETFN